MNKNIGKSQSKQIFCDTCNCYIPSEPLVAIHNKGRKHQKLLDRIQKDKKLLGCSVFVRGFKKESDIENDIKAVLGKYGCIKDVYVDKEKSSYAIVEFEDEKSVSCLLNSDQKFIINGHRLVIKRRQLKESKSKEIIKSNEIENETSTGDFLSEEALKGCNNINDQIEKLTELKQLTEDDIKLRFKLCEFLQEIFREVYHDCKIVPFGSTASGLGCRGCDLDMTLITEQLLGYSKRKCDGDDLNNVSFESQKSEATTDRSSRGIGDVCDILRKYAPGCKNVFPLGVARCPLIKFTHVDSGLHCDLSINNRLAVHNSELIATYCSVDRRFRYLSYAIRSWATAKHIAGNTAFQLTKYAWALLTIHYLQQCSPPVLPCLQEIKTGNHEELLIDGWNCHFESNCDADKKSSNPASLGDLLVGFFQYFAKFDWRRCTVAIDTSNMQTKDNFLQRLATNESISLFKEGPIWMPDPFELAHNVAHNMTKDGLRNLKEEFENALRSCLCDPEEDAVKVDHAVAAESGTDAVQSEHQPAHVISTDDARAEKLGVVPHPSRARFDRMNLLTLLKTKNVVTGTEKQKKSKLKFVFDIYGCSTERGEDLCRRCVTVIHKILKDDLQMQCSFEYDWRNGEKMTSIAPSGHVDPSRLICCKKESLSKEVVRKTGNGAQNAFLATGPKCGAASVVTGDVNPAKKAKKVTAEEDETSMKRRFQDGDDVAEPPRKMHRFADDREIFRQYKELETAKGEAFDCIKITATAWTNTWTNRRQQKRMLDVPKNAKGAEDQDVKRDTTLPSSLETVPHIVTDPAYVDLSSENRVEMFQEGSSILSLQTTDLQQGSSSEAMINMPSSRGNTSSSKPVCVTEVKVEAGQYVDTTPKCRIAVKLVAAEKLNSYHSLFAFFKKTVLHEMRR